MVVTSVGVVPGVGDGVDDMTDVGVVTGVGDVADVGS